MKSKIYILLILVASGFLIAACTEDKSSEFYPDSEFICDGDFQGDYWPTKAWRHCSPEEVGMDSEKLMELNEEIRLLFKLHFDIHSVIVIKDGYIVAEQYYSTDYGPDSLHTIYSCTKSLTSALIGIAIDHGYIAGKDEKMISFFPDYSINNLDENKQNITIENMLTMSAGLEWYELEYPGDDERNTFTNFRNADDRVKFTLDQPMIASPGEEYSYNTGLSHLLSDIVRRSTGIRADSFALQYLFTPLGITEYYWPVDSKNVAYGGYGVRMSPLDMARFGYLYLKKGKWENEQLIPEYWVEASSQKHIARKYIPDNFYGYHWWVSDSNYYSAVGAWGQWIMIIPEHDLVVVFTNNLAGDDGLQWSTPERLLTTYILPALK